LVFQLQNQIEQLKSTVVDLRRKQRLHNSQINGFIDERTNLLVEIQDHRRELHLMHQRLGLVQRENEDLMKSNVSSIEFLDNLCSPDTYPFLMII